MFITEQMGNEYVPRTGISLKESYKESNARTPLILIHSHGKMPAPCSAKGVDKKILCQVVLCLKYFPILSKIFWERD